MSIWKWNHAGIFVGGMLFATKGIELLKTKQAHKLFVDVASLGLKAREEIMKNVTAVREEADVGIAVNTGAAIAKEISDVMIESEDLSSLITLKDISDALMDRTAKDYKFIIGFNSALIALGAFGLISPATSAIIHNISTVGISLYNMKDYV